MRTPLLPWLCLLLPACETEQAAAAEGAVLRPRLPEIQRIAETAPAPLAEARAAELAELLELAYLGTDRRLAQRATRNLDEAGLLELRQALCAALLDERLQMRQHAAWQLGQRSLRSAVPALILRLKDETEPAVKVYLADALCRLGNHAAVSELVEGLHGPLAARVRPLVQELLQAAGLPAEGLRSDRALRAGLRMLEGHWQRFGRTPQDQEPGMGEACAPFMARRLLDFQGFQLRQVDEARYLFARMGVLGLELLGPCLSAEELYLRQHALEVLVELGPVGRPLRPAAERLLAEPKTRVTAVRALSAMGDQAVVPQLLGLLQSADLELRCCAAGALGPLRDQRAVPALRACLADAEAVVDLRVQAAFSLAILDPAGPGMPYLRGLLEAGEYHGPSLRELIQRAATLR